MGERSGSKTLLLFLLTWPLVSCQRGPSPELVLRPAEAFSLAKKEISQQSLETTLNTNLRNARATPCDIQMAPIEREILRALDQRREALEKLASARDRKSSADATTQTIWLGHTPFQRNLPQPPSEDDDKSLVGSWSEEPEGWKDVYDLYKKLPPQLNEDWIDLNSAARGLLMDDTARILEALDMDLGREDKEPLEKSIRELAVCQNNFGCVNPSFTTETLNFLESKARYTKYLNRLSVVGSLDLPRRRELIRMFYVTLQKDDEKRYQFTFNDAAKRISPNKLIFTLDAGFFRPYKSTIEPWILAPWHSDKLSIGIRWVHATGEEGIFTLKLGQGLENRATTDFLRNVVTLYANNDGFTFAHEFGHVIGFEDKYYTLWKDDTCQYVDEVRNGDIMSTTDGGVLPDEWQTLDTSYPYGK